MGAGHMWARQHLWTLRNDQGGMNLSMQAACCSQHTGCMHAQPSAALKLGVVPGLPARSELQGPQVLHDDQQHVQHP